MTQEPREPSHWEKYWPELQFAVQTLGVSSPGRMFLGITVTAVVVSTVVWALHQAWWFGIIMMCSWQALLLYWDSIPWRQPFQKES
jgi:hypothetical protein